MADELLSDYRWLTGGAADRLLAEMGESTEGVVSLATRLRRDLSATRTHLVLEQIELRRRAKQKFTHPERMFFTPLALEQASDERLAGYKAERFGPGELAVDLACGIGGDLLGLAGRGPVVGIDRNPIAATLAAANLERAALDVSSSRVAMADALAVDLTSATAWHIDPDRRPQGRRTTHVALHSPSADEIDRLRAACAAAAIKLAPAAEVPPSWAADAQCEWISRGRECRQLVVWFDRVARYAGRRSATVLAADGERTVIEQPEARLEFVPRISRYLFEPDPAVLAADLTATLAREHHLAAFTPGVGYLTGEQPIADASLAAFEVLDILPLRTKTISAWLRERGIGQLEIKKRGVTLEPEQLRRQLRTNGDGQATILIAPLAGKPVAMMARRL